MCVVSMVMDQWWPKRHPDDWRPFDPFPPFPKPLPNEIPWPKIEKDPALAAQLLEVLRKLEAIDRRLGLLEQCSVSRKEKRKAKDKLRRIAKRLQSGKDGGR